MNRRLLFQIMQCHQSENLYLNSGKPNYGNKPLRDNLSILCMRSQVESFHQLQWKMTETML